MDPLSVTASVIALLGAGGKIISLLLQVAAIADAPALAIVTMAEMTDISTALRHIQDFVNGSIKVPVERQQHILLEHLVATLTGCLITYSELDYRKPRHRIIGHECLRSCQVDLKGSQYQHYYTAATEPQELSQSHALYPAIDVDYRDTKNRDKASRPYGTIAAWRQRSIQATQWP